MANDRNQQARDAFAVGAQQRRMREQLQQMFAVFAGDYAAGKVGVIDRFAVRIKKGDLVLWTPPHQLVYEVVDIQPILQPMQNQPIGQIQVVLHLTAPVTFMAEQPAMGMIVVGHQSDPEHAELTTPTGATKDNVPPATDVPNYEEGIGHLDPPTGDPPDGDTGN